MNDLAYELPMDADQDLLSLDQAAKRLGVSKRTVQRLVANGELAQTYVASVPRIDPRELARYLSAPKPRRRRRTSALRPVASDGDGFVDRLRSQRR